MRTIEAVLGWPNENRLILRRLPKVRAHGDNPPYPDHQDFSRSNYFCCSCVEYADDRLRRKPLVTKQRSIDSLSTEFAYFEKLIGPGSDCPQPDRRVSQGVALLANRSNRRGSSRIRKAFGKFIRNTRQDEFASAGNVGRVVRGYSFLCLNQYPSPARPTTRRLRVAGSGASGPLSARSLLTRTEPAA
jgi:hypothetical protein